MLTETSEQLQNALKDSLTGVRVQKSWTMNCIEVTTKTRPRKGCRIIMLLFQVLLFHYWFLFVPKTDILINRLCNLYSSAYSIWSHKLRPQEVQLYCPIQSWQTKRASGCTVNESGNNIFFSTWKRTFRSYLLCIIRSQAVE